MITETLKKIKMKKIKCYILSQYLYNSKLLKKKKITILKSVP